MAAVLDLTIDQGATYVKPLTYQNSDGTPVNLTGYTASMQVRHRYAELEDGEEPLISLTTGAGITLGGSAGTILITITAEQSAGIPRGKHVYDLELSYAGTVTRLIQGEFTVSPEVTR